MIASGGFLTAETAVPAVVLFILYYMLENLRRPVMLGYVSDRIERGIMASGLSGESQAKSLFVAVFSPVIGLMADRLGVGWALIITGLAAGLLYLFIRLKK